MQTNRQNYFASMNTTKGFQNYFSNIFNSDCLEKIFILKGGPGTGKSSLMKKIAETEFALGNTVEYFLCSSDPESLDGILLKEKKIAFLDGTAPHVFEPNFPGITDHIINLGKFWDSEKLSANENEIKALINYKKTLYQRSYQFLSACGKICEEVLSFTKKQINKEKMTKNIKIQSSHFFEKGTTTSESIRNVTTICNIGLRKTDTFEDSSTRIWIVEDCSFSAHLYLSELRSLARAAKQEFQTSYSPYFPELPNALYFPKAKTCFVIGKRDYDAEIKGKEYHYINMKRFLDNETMKASKEKIKFAQKCFDELLSGAILALNEASETHKAIEKFYISAMNFSALNQFADKLIKNL